MRIEDDTFKIGSTVGAIYTPGWKYYCFGKEMNPISSRFTENLNQKWAPYRSNLNAVVVTTF